MFNKHYTAAPSNCIPNTGDKFANLSQNISL